MTVSYAEIEKKIITARVGLLMNQPFWGNLATRLKICDVTDEGWCPTAATDGKSLFINRDFVNKLSIKETQFLVGHEIGHCVLDHFGRLGDRDKVLWNVAGDYVINQELVDGGVGELIKVVTPLYDRKFRGMFTEEVYDLVKKDEEKYKGKSTLDIHLEIGDGEGDEEGKGKSDSESGDGGGNGKAPTISKELAKELRDEFREAVLAAAKSAGAGNIPGFVKKLIKDFTEPQISWRELLRQQIQSLIRADYTWQRPNRKTWSSGIYLPGSLPEETVDICVAIDVSGSISEQMVRDFLGEIQGIMDQFRDFKLKIWCFDTQVYNPQEYDECNRYDLNSYEIHGGGGTEFMANWNWMEENDIRPKKFIMFTDGYPWGAWGKPDYCDTVFIIHGTESIVPPFGNHAYYPIEKKH